MKNKHIERNNLTARFGEVLRQARKKTALTQLDVARRLGLATDVFGRMERGYMLPSVTTLLKLCQTLPVDANALLGLDHEKPPSLLEEFASRPEEHLELQRLMRTLRQMNAAQLTVMASMAKALLRYTSQEPEEGPGQVRGQTDVSPRRRPRSVGAPD